MPSQSVSSSSKKAAPSSGVPTPKDEVLALVNAERKKAKLAPLTIHPLLQKVAQAHDDDMVARKFYSHYAPGGSTPESRIKKSGYLNPGCTNCKSSMAFGENIGRGTESPSLIMKTWMNSPVHKANILRPDFREIGIGQKGGIWVQVFGKVEVKVSP